MVTTDNISSVSYTPSSKVVQAPKLDKKYICAPKNNQAGDTFTKIEDVINSANGTISAANKICSFINNVKDSVSYFVTKKASKDAKYDNFLNDKKICNVTAKISQDVYKKDSSIIEGWKPFTGHENKSTGFKAVAYQNGNNIIISYCGTNDAKDIASDTQMAMGKLPEQFKDANRFYEKICKNNPECNVVLTGHSLGGSLAELVASKNKDTAAVTFNAYGVEKIINSKEGKNLKMKDNFNTFNYIIDGDVVSNSSKHVGSTTIVQKTQSNNHAIANYVNLWA